MGPAQFSGPFYNLYFISIFFFAANRLSTVNTWSEAENCQERGGGEDYYLSFGKFPLCTFLGAYNEIVRGFNP